MEGSNDVLSLALGTPEHSGRVRGLPTGVTPTQFFKIPRSRKSDGQQDDRIRRLEHDLRLSNEENKKMQEQINELRELFKSQQSNINVGSSPGAGSGVGISASNPSPTPEPSPPPPPPKQVPVSTAPPTDEVVQPIITPTGYEVISVIS